MPALYFESEPSIKLDRNLIVAEDRQLNSLQPRENVARRQKTLQQGRSNPTTLERLSNAKKNPARVALPIAERLQPAISDRLSIDFTYDFKFRRAETVEPAFQVLDQVEALHGGAEMLKSFFVE